MCPKYIGQICLKAPKCTLKIRKSVNDSNIGLNEP
ncbi:hypothetical protein CBM2587_A170051 [Cupriavidus taiwanensis]|uniref:Uncharacterized protein n=1 Tax=Cupriavidus taiwanensis TaxID=164546 RepID=A0A375BMN8_9BURK|nr:hypothetical protein CBM2587_A170051 [Cupriavidus taiwanensis]